MARIDWADIRRPILFFLVFIILIVGINGLLSGRGGPSIVRIMTLPKCWSILTPFILFGLGTDHHHHQSPHIVRHHPAAHAHYGAAGDPSSPHHRPGALWGSLRQMGMPDKPAFTMDLAFRFIPTLARDFNITLDARGARVRVDHLKGGWWPNPPPGRRSSCPSPCSRSSTARGDRCHRPRGWRASAHMDAQATTRRDWGHQPGCGNPDRLDHRPRPGFRDFWFPPAWM